MKVLIVNAGSSSLKYQLIDMDTESTLAKGLVEKIGLDMGKLTHKAGDKTFVVEEKIDNHVIATQMMLAALTDPDHGVVIEENIPLGPLHNPANLAGIRACQKVMPNTPMVAVFDTAFHMTMPPKAYRYGVPKDYYTRLKVRRYGFHGTSHRYVAGRIPEYLGKKPEELRIINCHLGNGSSICAIDGGKCVDTSMGITPLEGLLMGTRCGSMDPAVVQYICNQDHIDVNEMLNICNKKSGLLGVSGVSSDMREVAAAAENGNEDAAIAIDMLVEQIRKYIGAYAAVLHGVDVISFTAGIGENDAALRARVMTGFEFLGAKMDYEKNAKIRGVEADVSAPDSKVRILIIPTNEELAIARDTMALVTAAK